MVTAIVTDTLPVNFTFMNTILVDTILDDVLVVETG